MDRPIPLTVWGTESFLLGTCAGEYQARATIDASTLFVDVLRDRLSQFVPDIPCMVQKEIEAADLPSDITWIGKEKSLGYSPSQPSLSFSRAPEKLLRTIYDMSRLSLVGSILKYLEGAAAQSQLDRSSWLGGRSDKREQLDFGLVQYVTSGWDVWERVPETDDPVAIIHRLKELIQSNDTSDAFELGCIFGRMVAALELFRVGIVTQTGIRRFHDRVSVFDSSANVAELEYGKPNWIDLDTFVALYGEFISSVLPLETVRQCEHARALLESEHRRLLGVDITIDSSVDLFTLLDELSFATQAIWLTFGEGLSFIRGLDAPSAESPPMSPGIVRPALVVEGESDKFYIESVARVLGRSSFVESIDIVFGKGASDVVGHALRLRIERPISIIAALFDWDTPGRNASDILTGKHVRFPKQFVLSYREWRTLEPSETPVEAEDMFPQAFLETFLGPSPNRSPYFAEIQAWKNGQSHFGFSLKGKDAFISYVKDNLTSENVGRWVAVLDKIERLLLPAKK